MSTYESARLLVSRVRSSPVFGAGPWSEVRNHRGHYGNKPRNVIQIEKFPQAGPRTLANVPIIALEQDRF